MVCTKVRPVALYVVRSNDTKGIYIDVRGFPQRALWFSINSSKALITGKKVSDVPFFVGIIIFGKQCGKCSVTVARFRSSRDICLIYILWTCARQKRYSRNSIFIAVNDSWLLPCHRLRTLADELTCATIHDQFLGRYVSAVGMGWYQRERCVQFSKAAGYVGCYAQSDWVLISLRARSSDYSRYGDGCRTVIHSKILMIALYGLSGAFLVLLSPGR